MSGISSPGVPSAIFASVASSTYQELFEHKGVNEDALGQPQPGSPSLSHVLQDSAEQSRAAALAILEKNFIAAVIADPMVAFSNKGVKALEEMLPFSKYAAEKDKEVAVEALRKDLAPKVKSEIAKRRKGEAFQAAVKPVLLEMQLPSAREIFLSKEHNELLTKRAKLEILEEALNKKCDKLLIQFVLAHSKYQEALKAEKTIDREESHRKYLELLELSKNKVEYEKFIRENVMTPSKDKTPVVSQKLATATAMRVDAETKAKEVMKKLNSTLQGLININGRSVRAAVAETNFDDNAIANAKNFRRLGQADQDNLLDYIYGKMGQGNDANSDPILGDEIRPEDYAGIGRLAENQNQLTNIKAVVDAKISDRVAFLWSLIL